MSGYGITTCAPQMALLDSNKGSFGNRVDCAVDHAKNNVKTSAKVAAVATGYAGASALGALSQDTVVLDALEAAKGTKGVKGLILKGNKFAKNVINGFGKYATKGLDTVAKKIFNKGPISTGISKVAATMSKAVSKNPAAAFVVTAFGLAAMGLAKISNNHAYNAGKIDAKYEARAKAQEKV